MPGSFLTDTTNNIIDANPTANLAAPDLKNSPKIEIKAYQLNNYYLFSEKIYFSISAFLAMLSQSNNSINSFFNFTRSW